ncbi:MAG: hypothetical protein KDK41_14950 [Leptospiraceae bacterium]|nr:hypothetical protein [Leptospiraceae bacterium]
MSLKKYSIYAGFLLLCPVLSGEPARQPAGYSNAVSISAQVVSYSASENSTRNDSVCIATETFSDELNKLNVIEIKNGRTTQIENIATIPFALPGAPVAFPAIACAGEKIVIAWQQIIDSQSGISYIVSNSGVSGLASAPPRRLTETSTAILPHLKASSSAEFFLFFQEKASSDRFSLSVSPMSSDNAFESTVPVIDNVSSLGKGIFFPSIVFEEGKMQVFFQKRNTSTLKDNIFKVTSPVNSLNFSEPVSVTDNPFNDYAPTAILTPTGIEYVWQSSPDKNWQIWHGDNKGLQTRLSSKSNAYQPAIAFVPGAGRIVVWTDFREGAPHIFARFLDRPENLNVGKEHDVSIFPATAPSFVNYRSSALLFYLAGTNLLYRTIDNSAPRLGVYSKIGRGEVTMLWQKPLEPSGIEAYAYLLDDKPDSEPQIFNLDGSRNSVILQNLRNGVYWFHIRYADKAGNQSRPAHYRLVVKEGSISTQKNQLPVNKELTANIVPQVKKQLTVPEIVIVEQPGILEVTFSGGSSYIWSLDTEEKFPADGNLSDGGPEYIYLQQPGKYFLNAAFVQPDKNKLKKTDFSSTEVSIYGKKPSAHKKYFIIVLLSLVLILFILFLFRKRIRWLFSKRDSEL